MRIALLAVDLDGTLLDEQGAVTAPVIRAVEQLRERGIACVAATGRRLASARPLLETLDLRGAAVVHNGAVVIESPTGPSIWTRYLLPEACLVALSVLQGKGLGSILYHDVAAGPDQIVIQADSPDYEGYLRWYTGIVAGAYTVVEDLTRTSRRRVTRIIAPGPPAVLEEASAWLAEHGDGSERSMLVTDPAIGVMRIEVLHREADKWSGVRFVADRLGTPPEAVAAVGDDLNDLGMIRSAGWGVAVRNAPVALQEAADHVTARPGPEGFLEVAERLLDA